VLTPFACFLKLTSWGESLPQPDLNELIAASGKLATLPITVIKLLDILNEPDASAQEIQKVLERDPAMTANVLKIANSAYFGVRREIASVRDALVMLGNRRTATLSFVTSMAPIMRRDFLGYGLTPQQFWAHALITAAASARVVCGTGNSQWQCEAFTAGLIHDLGMIILDPVLAKIQPSLAGNQEHSTICVQERDRLGFDHCQAGGLLAESWGFPEIMVGALSAHHLDQLDPAQKTRLSWPVVQAVAAGNILAEALINPESEDREAILPPGLEDLDLETDLLEKTLAELSLDLQGDLGEIGFAATSLVPALN